MLKDKLNKQVALAGWQLGLGAGVIIGYILLFAFIGTEFRIAGLVIGLAMIMICGIAQFVLWILGIVNAVAVNSMTGDSTILIVFSVLTFWFGHLIVAISQKNKYSDSEIEVKSGNNNKTPNTLFEKKLKQSFVDGIISSSEYEQKLKEYRDR